jgi:hypothetical protein
MPEQPTTEAADRPKWAIVAVHGVGETQPGATIDAFLPALAGMDSSLQPSSVPELVWLQELTREYEPQAQGEAAPEGTGLTGRIGDQDFIKLFPVHLRRVGHREGAPGIVAEVYWADLSHVREGVLHLLRGVFLIIFGLRDVADQAASQPGTGPRWLRSLLYVSAWLLRGPIAALNLFLLLRAMVGALTTDLARSGRLELPEMRISGWLGVLAIVGGFITWRKLRGRNPPWATLWCCVALVGMWVLGMIALRAVAPHSNSFLVLDRWIRNVPYFQKNTAPSEAQWCAAVVLKPILLAWDLETALMLLAGLIWLAACLEAWYSGRRHLLPSVTAAYCAAMLQLVLCLLIIPMLALIGMRFTLRSETEIDQLANLWKILGVQYLLASVLAAFTVLTWGARLLLVYLRPEGDRPLPRLLVGPAIQAALIGVILIASVTYVLIRMYDPQLTSLQSFPGQEIVGVLAAGFVLLVPILPASGLRTGLHIVADVINHFHRVPERFPTPWGGGSSSEDTFVVRRRIEARFRSVLAEVLKSEVLTHLTVVAHSQGTVVALDVLRQEDTLSRLCRIQEVTLVTMGSPFTHLYQHYFPRQYPSLREEYWRRLRERIPRWVNIYRKDDFVGTRVEELDGSWPRNHPLYPGGHTNYWRQRNVLAILSEVLREGLECNAGSVHRETKPNSQPSVIRG